MLNITLYKLRLIIFNIALNKSLKLNSILAEILKVIITNNIQIGLNALLKLIYYLFNASLNLDYYLVYF